MKSIVLFTAMLLCAFAAHSQDDDAPRKGVVGGTLYFNTVDNEYAEADGTKTQYSQIHEVGLNPYFGLWLDEKWMLGVQGGITYQRFVGAAISTNEEYVRNETNFSAGIFGRRYSRADKPVRFFLEAGAIYSNYKYIGDTLLVLTPFDITYQQTKAYVSPGFTWAVSKRFNILAKFGSLEFVAGRNRKVGSYKSASFRDFNLDLNSETLLLGLEFRL